MTVIDPVPKLLACGDYGERHRVLAYAALRVSVGMFLRGCRQRRHGQRGHHHGGGAARLRLRKRRELVQWDEGCCACWLCGCCRCLHQTVSCVGGRVPCVRRLACSRSRFSSGCCCCCSCWCQAKGSARFGLERWRCGSGSQAAKARQPKASIVVFRCNDPAPVWSLLCGRQTSSTRGHADWRPTSRFKSRAAFEPAIFLRALRDNGPSGSLKADEARARRTPVDCLPYTLLYDWGYLILY